MSVSDGDGWLLVASNPIPPKQAECSAQQKMKKNFRDGGGGEEQQVYGREVGS